MFQSFTGNSRRPRQVNLSGRTNNPFASTQSSSAGKVPGGGSSSSNALAVAQEERKARQHERERLNATKSIQRVWRGHQGRRALRNHRKGLLEANEEDLARKTSDQRTLEDVRKHLRLCVYTISPQFGNHWGAERLLVAGGWIYEKAASLIQILEGGAGAETWMALLRSLLRLLVRVLSSTLFPAQDVWIEKLNVYAQSGFQPSLLSNIFTEIENAYPDTKNHMSRLFILLGSIITIADARDSIDWGSILIPSSKAKSRESSTNSNILDQYYCIMGRMSTLNWLSESPHEQQNLLSMIMQAANAPVQHVEPIPSLVVAPALSLTRESDSRQRQRDVIYGSVILGLATLPTLEGNMIAAIRSVIDARLFYRTARDLVSSSKSLNQLECEHILKNLIDMSHRGPADSPRHTMDSPNPDVNIEFLSFVSSVLESFVSTNDMEQSTVQQLRSLTSADTISELFRRTNFLQAQTPSGETKEADVLSDYILNILRLLPHQADEIQMRLYLSHRTGGMGSGQAQKSAVRYFWDALEKSDLFRQALRGWLQIKNLLPEASGQNRSEWKLVVLFIEIYRFALRFQDDDEFIAGLNSTDDDKTAQSNALTITETRKLVEFLKNASYCLYLKNVMEQGDKPPPDMVDLKSIFQPTTDSSDSFRHSRGIASRGMNMQQLKEAVTALLRMLYERDSRRRFLPQDSFLMLTDEAESQHFVKSVIRESLLKERLDEEGDMDDEEDDLEEENVSSDWDRSRGVIASQHLRRVQRQSQREHHQRILAKQRARQEAAPRVELLENIPFLVPFETRVQLFRMHVDNDMVERRGGDPDPDRWRLNLHASRDRHSAMGILSAHQAELRRESIFEDAFEAFNKLGEGLKEPIRISFIGEEGIDGGGVTKEFLTSIINDVFRVNSPYRLFSENDDHMLYPNPNRLDEIEAEFDMVAGTGNLVRPKDRLEARKRVLEHYRFAGRLVGKCLYEGILVDIPVARFFVTKWALTGGDGAARNETTYRPDVNDMWDFDKAIYRGLLNLKNSKEDVSTWGMTFAVDERIGDKQIERDLKPGGADITVNNTNRLEYISRMVNYYLMVCQGRQTRAFLDGLSSIIKPTWLRMFNEAEIRVLLGGEERPIDVEDLRQNTVYSGVYQIGDDGQEHPTIEMFWETMHEMEDTDRRKLLQYVTSTPNAPLMGFAHLNPRFSIRDSHSDQGRLPTSSTCANLLKLPIYRNKATLRDRVMTAIYSGAGFDLS